MRLLALDTALGSCSVALCDLFTEHNVVRQRSMARGHVEALMPMLDEVVGGSAQGFGDVDRLVVTQGPGSFTGVRVGLSAARGLSLARGLPLLGVGTLHALARTFLAGAGASYRGKGSFLVLLPAAESLFYVGSFDEEADPISVPQVRTTSEILSDLQRGQYRFVCGDAVESLRMNLPASVRAEVEFTSVPEAVDPVVLCKIGSELPLSLEPVCPVYLRPVSITPPKARTGSSPIRGARWRS